MDDSHCQQSRQLSRIEGGGGTRKRILERCRLLRLLKLVLKAVLLIHFITFAERLVIYFGQLPQKLAASLLADFNEPGEWKNSKKKEKRAEIYPALILRIIYVMQNTGLVK